MDEFKEMIAPYLKFFSIVFAIMGVMFAITMTMIAMFHIGDWFDHFLRVKIGF